MLPNKKILNEYPTYLNYDLTSDFLDPTAGARADAGIFDNPGLFGKKLYYLFTFAEIIRVLPSHLTGICLDLSEI